MSVTVDSAPLGFGVDLNPEEGTLTELVEYHQLNWIPDKGDT
jgi:hypothetical protein